MKKDILIIAIVVCIFTSCSILSPVDPTPTPLPPTPTSTPDPCNPENVLFEVEDIQALVNGFQATMAFTNSILDPSLVIPPILRLQEIQMQIRQLKVPSCMILLKETTLQYTDSVIFYLTFYLNQNITQEEYDKLVENSQVLWQSVGYEFNSVLSGTGAEPQELPNLNELFPQSEGTGAVVRNNGTQAVNVRSAPNLDAEVVASLEPGMQALGIGRIEAGDWVQINLDGVFGWVFAETVTVNLPIDQLPVIEIAP
ncbi:MAG TPA: SH3 domain-containing protein [Pelolinea sp.]|nr:SH3 domain-containing protein [Pelolinea sp.]